MEGQHIFKTTLDEKDSLIEGKRQPTLQYDFKSKTFFVEREHSMEEKLRLENWNLGVYCFYYCDFFCLIFVDSFLGG